MLSVDAVNRFSFSKPVTNVAKVAVPEAVAALAATIDSVSVSAPPSIAPVTDVVPAANVKTSLPAPIETALLGAVADSVTVSTPAPPVKVAFVALTVRVDAPVVAAVLTAVIAAADKSAVRPAAPDTVTVVNEAGAAVKVNPFVPATVKVFKFASVIAAKVDALVAVVMFNVLISAFASIRVVAPVRLFTVRFSVEL